MNAPPLHHFTKAMLAMYEFPGTDAAVVFVPDGQEPSAEVQEVLHRSGQQRWYPLPGGHKAKVPWHFSKGHESIFEREALGWDHEHCDFCKGRVSAGEVCWTADSEQDSFWVFCKNCYEQLRDK